MRIRYDGRVGALRHSALKRGGATARDRPQDHSRRALRRRRKGRRPKRTFVNCMWRRRWRGCSRDRACADKWQRATLVRAPCDDAVAHNGRGCAKRTQREHDGRGIERGRAGDRNWERDVDARACEDLAQRGVREQLTAVALHARRRDVVRSRNVARAVSVNSTHRPSTGTKSCARLSPSYASFGGSR